MIDSRIGSVLWQWADPDHFTAHAHDFIQAPDEVLAQLAPTVAKAMQAAGSGEDSVYQKDFELPAPVGWSGLVDVTTTGSESFWGYRLGRTIPSHLSLGEKEQTRFVCLWGSLSRDRFVIHTMYPGRVAPREIHDPNLPLSEIPRALEFWSRFAMVVTENDFTYEPAE